ncbi:B3 domain-containing protein REM10-like isoform X2 [Lycium barbarum]|uniref:B3 domain-containing protein REM10-like isoform X2 n=1 Tax=Lycium barbarum TaxID=112863 RepID=UPI00293E7B10|nr:B3 domain-containing protein REM10-like isoform X2 [Lycium barbarum]
MKVPPKKPRFFKPILPGFKNGLKIPTGFLKYLKGHEHIKRAVLKSDGKKWLVKLNGRQLEDGWKKFVEELNLQLGDLLIFRHEGDMEFEVSIFDSSHLDREYGAEEKEHTPEETSKKREFKEKPKPNIMSSHKALPDIEAAKDILLDRPHLFSTVKSHWISKFVMHVPKLFARESGLINRRCRIMIRDEQRSWEFKLYYSASGTFIGGGWREFCAANSLKEGDRIMFEIFSKGETPILKFYDLRGEASLQPKGKKTNLDTERVSTQGRGIKTLDVNAPKLQVPASTSADANPYFISTIKSYSMTISSLYFPLAFAKSTGLMNGRREMILIDEEHRSWSMCLGQMANKQFGIRRGWTKFRKANGFQVGDTYMFELIHNGQIPIAFFHCSKNAGDVLEPKENFH